METKKTIQFRAGQMKRTQIIHNSNLNDNLVTHYRWRMKIRKLLDNFIEMRFSIKFSH